MARERKGGCLSGCLVVVVGVIVLSVAASQYTSYLEREQQQAAAKARALAAHRKEVELDEAEKALATAIATSERRAIVRNAEILAAAGRKIPQAAIGPLTDHKLETARASLKASNPKAALRILSEITRAGGILNQDAVRLQKRAEAMSAKQQEAAELAKKRAERQRKRRRARALSKLRKKFDDIEGVTWYHDKSTSRRPINSIHVYIGEKAGRAWLGMVVRYNGDRWLFVRKFIVLADGKRFDARPAVWKRDNNSEKVWEWINVTPSSDDLTMLKAIAKAE